MKKFIWVGLCALAILFRALLSAEAIEQYYSRGLFIFLRNIFNFFTNIFPFALVYLLFFLLLFIAILKGRKVWKNEDSWLQKTKRAGISLFIFLNAVVFLFLIMWGFNYGRVSIEDHLKMESKSLSINDLRIELDSSTVVLSDLRSQVPNITDSALTASYLPQDLENTMRDALKDVLQKLGYPTPGNVRGRMLYPKGLLLRISTAGVYIPFTGEGHIDPGLHPIQLPFVIAHEMSHGYGFGDEGTCNFLAYLACTNSENPYIKYVGHLSYWRYLASNYRFFQEEKYGEFYEKQLPETIKNDLRAIYKEMDKYPDIFPQVRDLAYETYLKTQGIEEGLENYSRILMLVQAWKQKGESFQ